jgi:predicted Zn-dependent peptidase
MPQAGHPDSYVLDVIASILSRGRTSRFYKNLVEDKKIALSVFASGNQSRYPDLFYVQATPLAPHTTLELEDAIYQEIEKLKTAPVETWELEKTRNQLEADFIRSLNSNTGLAFQLTNSDAVTGSWKFILTLKEERKKVTTEDILRVAQKYFSKANRTVATLVKTKTEKQPTSFVPEKKQPH